MEKENDDIERAMLFHVIDEFDVSGLLDIPDLTMDRTGDLRAAEKYTEKTRKDNRTVEEILDETEKQQKRNVDVQNGCLEEKEDQFHRRFWQKRRWWWSTREYYIL